MCSHGGRSKGAHLNPFYKGTNPICEGRTLVTYSPVALHPNTVALSTLNLGGSHTQTTTVREQVTSETVAFIKKEEAGKGHVSPGGFKQGGCVSCAKKLTGEEAERLSWGAQCARPGRHSAKSPSWICGLQVQEEQQWPARWR